MNQSKLKTYAPQARRDFIAAVTDRAALLGITPDGVAPIQGEGSDVITIGGTAWPKAVGVQRQALVEQIEVHGFDHVMEQAAYTWFNRFMALRYMELHGYLDHGYRVIGNPEDATGEQHLLPEILNQVEHVDSLPGLDREQVINLKLESKDEELYRLVLVAQCNAMHQAMPFLFEKLGDATELLLPDHLLRPDSILRKLVTEIAEDDWQQIEIIGWLYQFYISEKKDEVIGKVVKSEDIPAATQLFTPNWIVKYMVQNSLGAQWLATYPDSPLKQQMKYYIEPAEQTDEVNAQLAAITPSELNPEELTLIDPASGSGHILVEAYDLFKAIYLERGYRQRDVAQLILEKNLFGLDIDERAAQLTGFALMMKGRADDRRLFERGVKLNVMALVDSTDFDADALAQSIDLASYGLKAEDLKLLKKLFEHATTFGSLIQVPGGLATKLLAMKQLREATNHDLFVAETLKRLGPLVQQAELLAVQYDAVVANPPYMGSKYQAPVLKKFAMKNFPNTKSDLFAVSADRYSSLATPTGIVGLMTPFTWMVLKSYEALRQILLESKTLNSLIQPEYHAFFESAFVPICTFIFRNRYIKEYEASFIKLSDFYGADLQPEKTLEAIANPDCGWLYRVRPDEFRKIPGSPVAYWASDAVRAAFQEFPQLGEVANPRQGLSTTDNDRFCRFWQEVPVRRIGFGLSSREEAESSRCRWFPLDKGGGYRKWFGNNRDLVNWERDGLEIKNSIISKYPYLNGKPDFVAKNPDYYFLPGITWGRITSGSFSIRKDPAGFIPSDAGPKLYADKEEVGTLLLGLLNSNVVERLLACFSQTLTYEQGAIKRIPVCSTGRHDQPRTLQLVSIAKTDWDAYERSWDFRSLPVLTASTDPTPTLESAYTAWITQNRGTIAEMKRLEEENNRLFIDAYGLADELTPDVPIEQITLTVNPAYRYGGKLTEDEQWNRFRQDTCKELVSYAVGCMMGRYSLDEPGLIYAHSGNEGFDPNRYTTFSADSDGIIPITDIDWFEDDACNRLIEFISVAWPSEALEENLQWLAEGLGVKKNESPRDTLRRYLADWKKGFFDHHMSTYKKRPIYWMLSSGKHGAFQAAIYLHRYHAGTLARARSEYVLPLMGKLDNRIGLLSREDATLTNKERKELDLLRKQLEELRAFDEKLHHLADQRIELDLDEGVKVNYSKFSINDGPAKGDILARVKDVAGKKKGGDA